MLHHFKQVGKRDNILYVSDLSCLVFLLCTYIRWLEVFATSKSIFLGWEKIPLSMLGKSLQQCLMRILAQILGLKHYGKPPTKEGLNAHPKHSIFRKECFLGITQYDLALVVLPLLHLSTSLLHWRTSQLTLQKSFPVQRYIPPCFWRKFGVIG